MLATLWLAGPRAYAVVKSRLHGVTSGPVVELARVGVERVPDWLKGPVLEQVLLDLEPNLVGGVTFHDEAAARALCERVATTPWIAAAHIKRRHPNRFELVVELRRPVLAITADREVKALVAEDGVVLPAPPRVPDLPVVELPAGTVARVCRPGEVCADGRVICAIGVAIEWRDDVARRIERAPALLEIDARNLGGRYIADPRYSEVAIALASRDGGAAWMQYGRSEADGGAVDARTKADVLQQILDEFPGLHGLSNGDLRLRNRWRDHVVRTARVAAGNGR